MTKYFYCILLFLSLSIPVLAQKDTESFIQILGIAQDGGYPHMGCTRECCAMAWADPAMRRYVVCFALVDPQSKKWWLFEATPDIKEQLHYFQVLTNGQYNFLPDGIFVTHAHIGHYTGLMDLGREVMSTLEEPVYALPKMKKFLETNGPWSQLVTLHNIALQPLQADSAIQLSTTISVVPFVVPHRDEYSETAGFRIITPGKKYLFIPDINKWEKWDRSIVEEVKKVDIALVDATFFDSNELPNRNMATVPHPTVAETMDLFVKTGKETTSKIYFIHFNHTNPLLWNPQTRKEVIKNGFNIAKQGERL